MSCPFEEEVLLLRDDPIPASRRMIIEAHLARCESCARIDEAMELLDERLQEADEAPLGVVAGLRLAPRRRVLPLAAAAAILLAVAYLAWPGRVSAPQAPIVVTEETPPEPPVLPPPGASRGPAIATLVEALDPAAEDYADQVAAVAARVRAGGVAGATALADLLEAEDPRRALDVALAAPSPSLVAPVEALLRRPELATAAVRALAAAGSVRALVGALDGPAASEAREALVVIGGREVAIALEKRMSERGAEALELLDALARVDPPRAARACALEGAAGAVVLARHRDVLAPELRRLLSDERYAAGAARRLGEAGDRESEADLVRLAGRPSTARAATGGLLSLGAFDAAFSAARRSRAAREAFDGANQAEPFLLKRIERGPYAERRAAIELLARCGGEATVVRLASAPPERSLLDAAAATLGAIGGPEAIAALDRMRGERALRRDVVRALGATSDARALPVLRHFVGEDGVARDLCAALARIHEPESAEMLADLAAKGGASEEAARALTEMPASVVVPVLLDRMEGRGRARELLVRIAGTDHGPRRESWKEWWDSRP